MLLRGEWRQAWSAMRNAGDPVVTDTNPGGTAALPLASVEIDVLPAAPKPSEPPPAPSQPFPRMLDVLDDDSSAHFDAVRHGLETLGIRYEIDHGLVRGLDYYTRTAFEVHDRSLGAQSALGGGGRYDGLIEALGGPSTPGVGFSIGLDRALLALEERGAATGTSPASVFVVAMDVTRDAAARLLRDLRRTVTATADLDGKAFGAQMKAAGKSGARWLVLVGEDEWAREEVVVKDLTSGEQETVKATDVVERLRGRISSGA
jgi:histidyl-tRNA synthetase